MMLYIAGVTAAEIILAQTFSFFFMALAQSIPLFFFVTYVFDVSVAHQYPFGVAHKCYALFKGLAVLPFIVHPLLVKHLGYKKVRGQL